MCSAGKINTLIEYHLELRHRKRKLEQLLHSELYKDSSKSAANGDGGPNQTNKEGETPTKRHAFCIIMHGFKCTLSYGHCIKAAMLALCWCMNRARCVSRTV